MADIFRECRDEWSRIVQRITCTSCRAFADNVAANGKASYQTLSAAFRRKGWEIDGNYKFCMCPACVRKVNDEKRTARAGKVMEKKTSSVVELVQPGAPGPNSVLAKKIMSDLLFEHYDVNARDYKSGWNDARVAKESGLSEPFVAQRRGQDYGPVAPPKPPALVDGIAKLEVIMSLVKDTIAHSDAMKQRAEQALSLAEQALARLKDEQKKTAA